MKKIALTLLVTCMVLLCAEGILMLAIPKPETWKQDFRGKAQSQVQTILGNSAGSTMALNKNGSVTIAADSWYIGNIVFGRSLTLWYDNEHNVTRSEFACYNFRIHW